MERDISRFVGARIRHARERLGITQEELGARLSRATGQSRFSVSMLSLMESGQRGLKLEDVPVVAQVLNVPTSFLFGEVAGPRSSLDSHQVLLRATQYLYPTARQQVEDFVDQVESGPLAPEPVIKFDRTTRPFELVKAAGYREPPIDPSDVARKVGVPVVPLDLAQDVSGMLVLSGPRRAIGVNINHGLPRQRFTIAHELAHYVKEHSSSIDVNLLATEWLDSGSSYTEERLANTFAAEFLMPFDWVVREARIYRDPERLAERFGVSDQAMWIRLVETGLVVS